MKLTTKRDSGLTSKYCCLIFMHYVLQRINRNINSVLLHLLQLMFYNLHPIIMSHSTTSFLFYMNVNSQCTKKDRKMTVYLLLRMLNKKSIYERE